MRKLLNTLLIAAVMTSAVSCVMDISMDPDDPQKKTQTDLVLRLKTPGSYTSPTTRSLSYAAENTIDDVYVLLFDNADELVDIKAGQDVKDATGTMTHPEDIYSGAGEFKVTLPPSMGVGTSSQYKLVVLANAREILIDRGLINDLDQTSSTIIGNSYSAVIKTIYDVIESKMYPSGGTIPMWGETPKMVINPSSKPSVDLMRAIARIDVGVGHEPIYTADQPYPWSWDGLNEEEEDIPFELQSVNIVRPNNRYALIPVMANLTEDIPTIPASTTKLEAIDTEAAKFAFAATDGLYSTQDIYIPEAETILDGAGTSGDENHLERMAVVVGGVYDENGDGTYDEETSYYRIDFARNGNMIDVLRNHLYQFSIQKVTGEGYPDVITAYEANAMNMTCEILDWDEGLKGMVHFDGTYYLNIFPQDVVLDGDGEIATVEIKTNVPDFTLTLGGEQLVANDPTKKTATIDGITYTLSGPEGDIYTVTIEAPANTSTVNEIFHDWTLKAKRFTTYLRVTQEARLIEAVYAAPGQVGIKKSDLKKLMSGEYTLEDAKAGVYSLTLRGSSTYAADIVGDEYAYIEDIAEEFGGLEEEPVYAVYFKWGSMVAMIGGRGDTWSANDVVWVNDDYARTITDDSTASIYGGFTQAEDKGSGIDQNDIVENAADGHGDICAELTGGIYRTPGTGLGGTARGDWSHVTTVNIGVSGRESVVNTDKTIFLPAAGCRDRGNGSVRNQGDYGSYLSSVVYGEDVNYFYFDTASIHPSITTSDNSGFAVRCVRTPEPARAYAAPGQVGIKKSDYDKLKSGEYTLADAKAGNYTLTLKGSSTYAKTEVGNDYAYIEDVIAEEFGGLENEPVYAVYFKWGSMVAMIGGEGDEWSVDDVVWVNPDFVGTITASNAENAYGGFSAAKHLEVGGDNDVVQAPFLGHGDICAELTKGGAYPGGTSYRTPRGGLAGWYGSVSTDWNPVTAVNTGGGTSALVNDDKTIFLPAAGYRNAVNGMVSNHGVYGIYWSTTAHNDTAGFNLYFLGSSVYPTNANLYSNGSTVRCVNSAPAIPKGIRVPAGVIGYYGEDPDGEGPKKAGDLTLEGDSYLDFGDGTSPVPVYAAFFKFGSLVAAGSHDNGPFTSADIVASPTQWKGDLAATKAYVASQEEQWRAVPEVSGLATNVTIGTNLANALGDPCDYYFGDGDGNGYGAGSTWRLPSHQDNIDFVGRDGTSNDGENYPTPIPGVYYNWDEGTSESKPSRGIFPMGTSQGTSLPAAGNRQYNDGSMYGNGTEGVYWSSTADDEWGNGRILYFGSENMSPSMGNSLAFPIRCIQPAPTAPVGVHAAPGVIGYKADGSLTLKGSSVYASNAEISQYALEEFGGLENEPVYAAYFKFGSLVAISSDPTDNEEPYLEPDDILAAPTEWKGDLEGARAAIGATWGNIPEYTSTDHTTASKRNVSHPSYHVPSTGKGDPCMYYFGTEHGGDWKLPTGNPYNGSPDYDPTSLEWKAANGWGTGLPAGRMSKRAGEAGLFFPAAGYRYTSGSVNSQGSSGFYWSSSAASSAIGYNLSFGSTILNPLNYDKAGGGNTVRCVKPLPVANNLSVTPDKLVFEYDEINSPQTVTVTADGPWTVANPDEANFTVVVTPGTAANNWDGSFTVVPKTATVLDGRNINITVTATGSASPGAAPKTVNVIQMGNNMVYAAPGVVGIKRSDYKKLLSGELNIQEDNDKYSLTLRGSNTYAANKVGAEYAYIEDIADQFGGLENEEVYAVYFKWGSMVAMIGGYGDPWSIDDVVWVNDDYNMGAHPITGAAGDVNYGGFSSSGYTTSHGDYDIINVPAEGEGDICNELTKDGRYGGVTYRTPRSGTSGWNNSKLTDWTHVTEVNNGGLGSLSIVNQDRSIFLPGTSSRGATGYFRLEYSNVGGSYWATTASSGDNGMFMQFTVSTLSTGNSSLSSNGFAVRCVKPAVVADNLSVTPTSLTFEWDENTSGDAQTVTVTADGPWTVANLDETNFTVVVTPGTAANNWDGSFTVVPTSQNTGASARTVNIVVTATGSASPGAAPQTVAVTHNIKPGAPAGVHAAPGIIGYKANGELTLKGSSVYAANAEISQYALEEFGGLETEPVYVAMFKFGSLVAVSSDPTDTAGSALEPEDIIAGPSEWTGYTALKASPTWAGVPKSEALSSGATIATNASQGLGDPCAYWFDGEYDENWRLPTGDPYNGGAEYSPTSLDWKYANDLGTGIPAGRMSKRPGEAGMFFPVAGYRYNSNGGVSDQSSGGYYWSSTAHSNTDGNSLYFTSDGVHASNFNLYANGHPVRCVKPAVVAETLEVDPEEMFFEWDYTEQIGTYRGNVYADGPWTVSNPDPTNFSVIVDHPGTADNGWDGRFTIAPRTPNNGTSPRTVTITVTATGSNPVLSDQIVVTQKAPAPAGVHAAPGVIGYKANGELTLKGSSVYASNAEISQYALEEFGGLEQEPVYTAYFKFGSLVAVSSDPTDTAGSALEPEDIIAGPSQWTGYTALKSSPTMAGIPSYAMGDYSTKNDVSDPSYHIPSTGKGDPCMYYFGDKYDGGWRLPVGGSINATYEPARSYASWNAGTFGVSTYMNPTRNHHSVWYAANGAGSGIPAGMRAGDGSTAYPADWSMFLPAAGRRAANGTVENQGSYGQYWSSMAGERSVEGYMLIIGSGIHDVHASSTGDITQGYAVRCVQPLPVARSIEASPDNLTFEWGDRNSSTSQTVTVKADGPWFVTKPAMGNFIVEITTPGTAANNWDGTFTVYTNSSNGTTTTRNDEVSVVALGSSPVVSDKVSITQERQPVEGVRVPNGVIGYYATDGPDGRKKGALTLEGDASLSYGNGTSPVPVYAAYFKWGSLVATSSQHNGDFTSADIVAAKGFAGHSDDVAALAAIRDHVGTGTARQQWNNIPYGDDLDNTSATPIWPTTVGSAGIGDACTYYFGSEWKTPTRQDNIDYIGRDGTSSNGATYNGKTGAGVHYRWTSNGGTVGFPSTGTFPMGIANNEILPAAGSRNTIGWANTQGSAGNYWSSTANNAVNGYCMSFFSSNVTPSYNTASYSTAMTIRCVKLVPVEGVRVPDGVIGYYATDGPGGRKKGDLTLEGDANIGYGNGQSPVPVYAAYFQFGSLVAVSSEGNGAFTSADIVASPTQWKGDLTATKTYVGSQANQWAALPVSSGTPQNATIGTDLTAGLGDPCDYYFGDGDGNGYGAGSTWRLPSNQENRDFIGHSATTNHDTSYEGDTGTGVHYRWALTGTASAANPGIGTFLMGTARNTSLPAGGQRGNETGGVVRLQGTHGSYWSSTSAGNTAGWGLAFQSGYAHSSSSGTKTDGKLVRCVR